MEVTRCNVPAVVSPVLFAKSVFYIHSLAINCNYYDSHFYFESEVG